MRFGVNYTPSQGWFHSWLDFDPDAVARDLGQIAELGADHVRVFPLWPLVQPNRTLIRRRALDDVVRVVDLAGAVGLDVAVDALQGHLSSFDFVPSWLESWHRRNLFTDPDVVSSTTDYVRALAGAVAERPNVMAITVGNEVNQFAHHPHPTPHPLTPEQGDAWLTAMAGAAREGLGSGSRALVCAAQYDAAWYDPAQPFGPTHAAEHGDATVVHSWVFNGAARMHGALGAGSVRHAEYLLQLAAAWGEPTRPAWLQEVGSPTNVVPHADGPEFLTRTVQHAVAVPHLLGVTWWCSHDVPRSLADFPDLEYDLGLCTSDGRVKPIGRRFAELAAEHRADAAAVGSRIGAVLEDVDARTGESIDPRAECGPDGPFAAAWLAIAETEGESPQVVLRSRAVDSETLAERGIDHLVALDPAQRILP